MKEYLLGMTAQLTARTHAQDQANQNTSTGIKGAPEVAPLSEEILVIAGSWRGKVMCLQGFGS